MIFVASSCTLMVAKAWDISICREIMCVRERERERERERDREREREQKRERNMKIMWPVLVICVMTSSIT